MKRFLIILLVAVIAFGGIITYAVTQKPSVPAESGEISGSETAENTENAESTESETLFDYNALYRTHEPEETVMTVNGEDISWDEYFQNLSQCMQEAEYYGMTDLSAAVSEGEDTTWDEYIRLNAEEYVKNMYAVTGYCSKNGIELTDEIRQSIDETLVAYTASVCGEGATEEDLAKYLKEQRYVTLDTFKKLVDAQYLVQNILTLAYGENCEKITDEQAVSYLEENGYINANHILLLTMDMTTREELDEAKQQEKEAQAKELSEQLKAAEGDNEKLVALFEELKEQYDEDSGKATNPHGYTFKDGVMVKEFEEAAKALDEYEISDPVKSTYGYHVIMRLPLDPDALIAGSSSATGRMMCASKEISDRIQEEFDNSEVRYSEGFRDFKISDIV